MTGVVDVLSYRLKVEGKMSSLFGNRADLDYIVVLASSLEIIICVFFYPGPVVPGEVCAI